MPPKPSITVESPGIRAAQRRMAVATVVIPLAGTVAAAALAVMNGVGGLEIGLLVGMYVLTSVGVEVGLHRGLAHRAFDLLTGRGFTWLYVMQGGMKAWRRANRPVAK